MRSVLSNSFQFFSEGSDGETGVYIIPNVSHRKWIHNKWIKTILNDWKNTFFSIKDSQGNLLFDAGNRGEITGPTTVESIVAACAL